MRQQAKKSSKIERRRINKTPSISIIGSGRLGTTLGRALNQLGYRVQAVVAKRIAHARQASKFIGPGVEAFDASRLDRLPPSDLILITTPDDAIGEVAASLAGDKLRGGTVRGTTQKPQPSVSSGRVVLHASGALSSAILTPLKEAGFSVGSMHPLVSISDPAAEPGIFRGAFFCLEGDAVALRLARRITSDLGGQSFSLKAADKPLYHAAAVMSSGNVVALFDIAIEMLMKCGLTKKRAAAVLLPLLQSTTASLVTKSPALALTGPFARGDGATAQRHLQALNTNDLDEALAAYKLLGKHALRLAAERGLNRQAVDEITGELQSALRGTDK